MAQAVNENLNAEQIKNAVACRTGNIIGCMNDECAYFHKGCDRPLFEDILLLIEFYEDKIFELENRLKECENGYEATLNLERAKIKKLTEENERLREHCKPPIARNIDILKVTTKADTVREMQKRLLDNIKGSNVDAVESVCKWINFHVEKMLEGADED